MFRPVDRHGRIAAARLSGDAISVVVKERVADAGLDPAGFSGHSLRAGFATSAAQAGISSLKIRAQTGHASDQMLARCPGRRAFHGQRGRSASVNPPSAGGDAGSRIWHPKPNGDLDAGDDKFRLFAGA